MVQNNILLSLDLLFYQVEFFIKRTFVALDLNYLVDLDLLFKIPELVYPSRLEKIELDFSFCISLRCLKKFYEGLKDPQNLLKHHTEM